MSGAGVKEFMQTGQRHKLIYSAPTLILTYFYTDLDISDNLDMPD